MIDPFQISPNDIDRVGERSRTPPPMNSIGSMALPSAPLRERLFNDFTGRPGLS
jgi:hypothetical protein